MAIYASILSILKYSGIFLATISSIWSTTNVISREVDGRKKLTRAGKVAIILTLSGLFISVISNILEDHLKSREALEASVKEIRKTNKIILAGQQLVSLDFEIKCANSSTLFNKLIKNSDSIGYQALADDAQGEQAGSRGDALYLEKGVLPLFKASLIGKLKDTDNYFLFLISIGENAVLSCGYLNDDTLYPGLGQSGDKKHLKQQNERLSKGIVFRDIDLIPFAGVDNNIQFPKFVGDTISTGLSWNIEPSTLHNCLDKIDPDIPLSAYLPETIKIAFLFDFKSLPFYSNKMTSGNGYIWSEDSTMPIDDDNAIKKETLNHIYTKSSLELIPNGLKDQSVHYDLQKIYAKQIVDEDFQEEAICRGVLLIYRKSERE